MPLFVQALGVIMQRWKSIVAASLLTLVVVFMLLLLFRPRQYSGNVLLATVGSSKTTSGLGGLAASLSGAGPPAGFFVTPDLLAQIVTSRRVLLDVAYSPVVPGRPRRVLDSLTHGDGSLESYRTEELMRDLVSTSVERKTGLISVSVTYKDSALARVIATRVIEGASSVVVSTAKAQAALQRAGQERRVEDAAAQVRQRQQEYIEFLRRNRSLAAFSEASLERDRLQRASELAQTTYSQAVADRENARARELEETPAVVVVDSFPRQLTPMPRRASLFAVLASIIVFCGMVGVLTVRQMWSVLRAENDPVLERIFGRPSRVSVPARGDSHPRTASDAARGVVPVGVSDV